MASKAEIQKQVEEIERAVEEDEDEEDDYEDDEDDDEMLSRRIKQNEQSKADNFTLLYVVVAVVTAFCPTYLFMTVLDMDPMDPINAVLYLVVAGVTCYFLVEAYKQMYDTESRKASQGEDGKVVTGLEKRLNEKVASLDGDLTNLPKLEPGATKARTPQEIFHSTKGGGEWKSLSDGEQAKFRKQSIQEEVQLLRSDIAEYKHLQTQCAMGWCLLFCNGTFITISTVVSFGLLRSYDPRISFCISTFAVGLLVQLLAKQNDEAAKNAAKEQKKKNK